MTSMKYGRHLLAVALIALAGTAHGATVYTLKSITLNTGNAPGTYNWGVGPLAAARCYSCGYDTATDDDFGNIALTGISYKLAGFGADFIDTFTGTTVLGANSSLLKAPGESCVVNNAATQYCSSTDNRSYAGDWLSGLLADGITPSNSANLSATVSGTNLVISVRKALTTTDVVGTKSWLQLNFNYTTAVVPVPAAVWLFGSALGILGVARRRTAAA